MAWETKNDKIKALEIELKDARKKAYINAQEAKEEHNINYKNLHSEMMEAREKANKYDALLAELKEANDELSSMSMMVACLQNETILSEQKIETLKESKMSLLNTVFRLRKEKKYYQGKLRKLKDIRETIV